MGAEVAVNVGYEYEEDKLITMDGNETPQSRRRRTTLITRDLLGVASNSLNNDNDNINNNLNNNRLEFQEEQQHGLDLDLQVPTGWEKRLDLQSGKVYLQKCNSSVSNPSSHQRGLINHCIPKLPDFNFLHSPRKAPLNLFDDAFLDLKLLPSASSPSSSSSAAGNNYNSVCTLDKVRHALERAEKEPLKKRSPFWMPSSPSPSPSHSSSSSYSMKETRGEDDNGENVLHTPIAAGCPSCLLYVLISVKDPKCPRCNVPVPLPNSKKPRIDLNMSI